MDRAAQMEVNPGTGEARGDARGDDAAALRPVERRRREKEPCQENPKLPLSDMEEGRSFTSEDRREPPPAEAKDWARSWASWSASWMACTHRFLDS